MYLIKTPRLGLRNWIETDIAPMTAINLNEEVMRFFPSPYGLDATKRLVKRMQKEYKDRGHCYFAVDLLETGEFIGFIGLSYQDYLDNHDPFVDIGWRLAPSSWGKGLAPEGAQACLDYAFSTLKLDRVYAVAPEANTPSQRVMQKIGMEQIDVFDHPKLLDHERLKTCVLYRANSPILAPQ